MAAVISNNQIYCYSLKGHSRIEEYEAEERREVDVETQALLMTSEKQKL